MSYLKSCVLNNNKISRILENAIDIHGCHSFDQVKNQFRGELVSAIIELLGTDAYQLLIGSDNFDKTLKYFSNYINSGRQEDGYDLLTQMRECALDHYEYGLEKLFDEIKSQSHTYQYAGGF